MFVIANPWYMIWTSFFFLFFPEKSDLGFGIKLCVGVGSNGLDIKPGGNESSYLGWWGTPSGKKKKTKLLDKLNANAKLLLELKGE